jgi:hypothetical protein
MLDLRCFARLLSAKGRAESGVRILGCPEAVHKETGVAIERWIAAMTEASMGAIREQLDEPAIAQAMQEGRTLSTDEALALALESVDRACRPDVGRAASPPRAS